TSLPNPDKTEDTASFKPVDLKVGDTAFYSNGFMVVQDLNSGRSIPGIEMGPKDSVTVASIKVTSKTSTSYTTHALLLNKDGGSFSYPDTVMSESLVLQLQKVEGQKVQLGVKESNAILKYVTLKAYKFPFINLVWLGTIIMVIGFFISALHRRQGKKNTIPQKGKKREEPGKVLA
ncbi:MAG: cytochrome c biogenesis protein ResB, partial [Flavisolibacter sp.]